MNKNYLSLSDEEIICEIRNDDLKAQEFLLDKYKNTVKAKTNSYFIVGGDKEDLIQEGMIGLFNAITDFNFDKNVSFNYFANLCINRQIFTAIKTATRKKHIPLNSYLSLNRDIDLEYNSESYIDTLTSKNILNPEDLFISIEDKKIIEEFINNSLSQFECKVLDLYLKEKSYSEIGEALSKDEKSIDNAIQRIRKKIGKVL